MSKKILAVAAHPDDLEFSCIMTLEDFIKEGYEVTYLIITNGENGCKKKSLTREERISIRKNEQLKAADALGVKDVIFWEMKDGFLTADENLKRNLAELIKEKKPEIIFSFDPANTSFDNINVNHSDHRNSAVAVFDAVFAAKNEFIYPSEFKPHRVKKLFFFGSANPNYFTDITNRLDRKLDIISLHESQFSDFGKFSQYFKEILAKNTDKFLYSEAFRVVEVLKIT